MGMLKPSVDVHAEVTLLTARLHELCQELDLVLRDAEQQRKRLSTLRDRAASLLQDIENAREGNAPPSEPPA